jgi:2,5-furandicarboxylate decarboxylase 1
LINSLREYIEVMRENSRVLEIKDPVSKEDIPELIEKLSDSKKILLFENVEGYSCRLVANCVPSLDVFKIFFDGALNPGEAFLEGVKKSCEKVPVSRGHLNTVDVRNKDLLDFLPILKHYQGDSAPFITTSIISSIDPDSGFIGRGVHRMEYRGKNLLGATLLNPPLGDIYRKYKERHIKMPVTISIGVDPLFFIAMALKAPWGADKMGIAGGLRGKGIEVIPSFDSSIDVPAESEIYLEGYVNPDKLMQDGPLGEISGYYLTLKETPTVEVQRMTYRDSPIYQALLPTSPEADMYLVFVSSAHIEENAKRLFPFISRITFIQKTFGSSVVVNVGSIEKYKIRSLIMFLLSFPMIKKAVIVDDDVNAEDLRDVEWAIVTRSSASEDVIIVEGLQGQPIDPQSEGGNGVAKMGINATVQGKSIQERAHVVKGDSERVNKIINLIVG